jgi:DeoR/GlpR family transcriptional regulator of sugar metabolism
MSFEQRLQGILEMLDLQGQVFVTPLVERFGVTAMTIRRDLDQLERKGLLRRVRGGAVAARGRSYEPPLLSRARSHPDEKRRIGVAAAGLVRDGESITLDVGTTALEVARGLLNRRNITVVTPSLHVAGLLGEQNGIRLILTGGILRPGELSLVGDLAERAFRDFFVDKLFLGIGGLDPEAGLTEFSMEDALVKRAMVRSAKEIIVVADASKFGKVAFSAVAGLEAVGRVVTDSSVDRRLRDRLESAGIKVTVV